MSTDTHNPYASPTAAAAGTQAGDHIVPVDWKTILRRWEMLRIPFNLVVGIAGLIALSVFPAISGGEVLAAGIVVYGIGANVCYLFGPIAELYVNWFMEGWGKRLLPEPIVTFFQSKALTWLMFLGGTLFSVILTLFIGFLGAIAGLGPQ
jgi:hypothetical protein